VIQSVTITEATNLAQIGLLLGDWTNFNFFLTFQHYLSI